MECCAAAFRRRQEEKLYRAYLTDTLNAIAGNTMRYVVSGIGGVDIVEHGEKMGSRWIEMADRPLSDPEPEEKDTRTAREITDGIWARMKGGVSR